MHEEENKWLNLCVGGSEFFFIMHFLMHFAIVRHFAESQGLEHFFKMFWWKIKLIYFFFNNFHSLFTTFYHRSAAKLKFFRVCQPASSRCVHQWAWIYRGLFILIVLWMCTQCKNDLSWQDWWNLNRSDAKKYEIICWNN